MTPAGPPSAASAASARRRRGGSSTALVRRGAGACPLRVDRRSRVNRRLESLIFLLLRRRCHRFALLRLE